jgi:hypothetical protein
MFHSRDKDIRRAWRYNYDILNAADMITEAASDELPVHPNDVGRYIEHAIIEGFRAGLAAGLTRSRRSKPKGPSNG